MPKHVVYMCQVTRQRTTMSNWLWKFVKWETETKEAMTMSEELIDLQTIEVNLIDS